MTGPGTPLRSSLPSSSSLRAGNCTPSRYLPTWAGKRFLKKSTVRRLLLLLVDWRGDGTARRGTPTAALRCSAKFAFTAFSEVRARENASQALAATLSWQRQRLQCCQPRRQCESMTTVVQKQPLRQGCLDFCFVQILGGCHLIFAQNERSRI